MKMETGAVAILLTFSLAHSQGVRKSFNETTAAERAAYVAALQGLYNSNPAYDIVLEIANYHYDQYSYLHSNSPEEAQFLAWHRMVLWEMEDALQRQNARITIPYLNWMVANAGIDDFMDIGQFEWSITRSMAIPEGAGSYVEDYADLMASPYYWSDDYEDNFSSGLEGGIHTSYHNFWGSGTMKEWNSPLDPLFYLHHSMVDKVWQTWEMSHGTSYVDNNPVYFVDQLQRYDGYYYSFVLGANLPDKAPLDIVDARTHGIFYSDDATNTVTLDGGYSVRNQTGYASEELESFVYPGTIEASDFTVPAGKSAYINSNTRIILKPGFTSRGSLVVKVGGYDDNFPTSFAKKAPTVQHVPPEAKPGILRVDRQAFGLTVDLQVEKAGAVIVEAFDVGGRMVSLPQKQLDLGTGRQSVQMQLRERQTGPLYLRVRMGEAFHRRIVPAI